LVGDLGRRVVELRFLDGVEKVEHVPYRTGDQFWVRFNKPLDLKRLHEVLKSHGYSTVSFANMPSRLPRKLAEVLWDGVTLVIVKNVSGWTKFKASLGFEPEGIAKIAADLHGPYQIFMTTDEAGVQVLYEYLGVKYVPPPPPASPKPATPAKPVAPTVAKPSPPPGMQPSTAPVGTPAVVVGPSPPSQPQQAKPVPQQQAAPVATPVKMVDSTQAQAKKETTKTTG
jgi:hypothetical protein